MIDAQRFHTFVQFVFLVPPKQTTTKRFDGTAGLGSGVVITLVTGDSPYVCARRWARKATVPALSTFCGLVVILGKA